MRRCTCTNMTARALLARDCLATSSFTIRRDCISRWATARLPKFTSTRPYKDKNKNRKTKKDKKFSHLKNTSFTVLTKGSTIQGRRAWRHAEAGGGQAKTECRGRRNRQAFLARAVGLRTIRGSC